MNGGSRTFETKGRNPESLQGFVKSRPEALAIANRSGRESSSFALMWPGYRLYCGRSGTTLVVLLCGGDKSTQSQDIERAKGFWADWKRREK
jgi:hypothetical protein